MLRKVVEGSVIQRNHREKTGTLRSRERMQVRSELAQGGVCRHALNELLALALDGQCYVATASSNFSFAMPLSLPILTLPAPTTFLGQRSRQEILPYN